MEASEMPASDLPQDDDPITASYNVYINPSLPSGRKLLVLQHPNRTDDTPRAPPTELRLKAASGMVEVDVPLDHSVAYDREKGLNWGRTLKASMAAKNGGSHGVAGGFGFGAVQQRAGGRRKLNEVEDDDVLDWNEAMRQDKVLTTQTLGGHWPNVDEVQYMVGVFQGQNLHLTPVSSLIHLRPQLHHLDAQTEQERQASAKDSSSSSAAGAGAGASSASASARAIHMTIKTTNDGETVTTETMADRLRSVQSERWRRFRYTDENEEAAWDVYNESLFLTPKLGQDGKGAKGKDMDGQGAAAVAADLEGKVARFETRWKGDDLLEAVSEIRKPKPEEQPPPAPVQKTQDAVPVKTEGDKRPKGRARGGATSASTRGRGGRKATASRPVEIE